ncbi:MAG: type II toxin-antitoxin system VapC family toxin [Pirellulales bacterium]
MARYFLDSSALVKRYHHESGSSKVEQLFAGPGNRLLISRLALVEVRSSFARLVREQVLTGSNYGRLAMRLDADASSGIIVVAALTGARLSEAAALLGTLGLTHAMRTLDAIHLATAHCIHKRTALTAFVAADKKLLTVAESGFGLPVVDVG